MISVNTVQRYYTSIRAAAQDRFNPFKVLLVCAHGEKTHKGKVFRFASEADVVAFDIMKKINRK